MSVSKNVANILLNIGAVHLRPEDPFTWTSGIKSPIYCDNRKIISYPTQRREIVKALSAMIKEKHPEVELIAGTATAGISWAAWISEELDLPMIYIRGSKKGHGLSNQIEGDCREGQKTVIIEDLISTGKSSIEAFDAAKEAGLDCLEVAAIFSYNLKKGLDAFSASNLTYTSLSSIEVLTSVSVERGDITSTQKDEILAWRDQL